MQGSDCHLPHKGRKLRRPSRPIGKAIATTTLIANSRKDELNFYRSEIPRHNGQSDCPLVSPQGNQVTVAEWQSAVKEAIAPHFFEQAY